MPEVARAYAHAKVNLVLEVLGKRADGYHNIDTILQEVELADLVDIEPSEEWGIAVSGPHATGTPVDESNLALKAAKLLSKRVSPSYPCLIRLEKHIPAAGGLGGGASDAVAVMRLLAGLWPAATEHDIIAVSHAVGSDETFFVHGGTSRAEGRGELVTALPPLQPHDIVLFVPRHTIERKTARMFEALGKLAFDSGSIAAAFAASPPATVTMETTFNAFERVAFELFPWLAALWADLEVRTGEAIRLAGAGPCLFWIGPAGGAEIAAKANGADCEVILTRTVARS